MRALPLFALAAGGFVGGLALNANADNRLAAQQDAASRGGPPASIGLFRAESALGSILAVAGLVGVAMSVVKAVEE